MIMIVSLPNYTETPLCAYACRYIEFLTFQDVFFLTLYLKMLEIHMGHYSSYDRKQFVLSLSLVDYVQLLNMHFLFGKNLWTACTAILLKMYNYEFREIVHPHLYKQPPSRSVKALKRKMERLHSKYVFAPADKAANNVIII